MIKSRRGPSCPSISHAIIILLLLLIGLLLAYVFLYKVERFQGGKSEVVVKYYFLPMCKYCKEFKPEWDKFVAKVGTMATTEQIDGSTSNVPEYVKGFPYVEFVVNGKAEEYKGDRSATALMDKVRSYL